MRGLEPLGDCEMAMAHTLVLAAGTAAAGPVSGIGGRAAFVLIAIVVVVIAAIAVIPMIIDVRQATAWRQRLTEQLLKQGADDPGVRDLLRDLREPRGVRGLTRSVIAVLILALVAFALAVAMLSSGSDSGDLRKTIVTSLMTVLATVAGFYFGSLGAQNSAEDARRQAAPRPVVPPLVMGGTPAGQVVPVAIDPVPPAEGGATPTDGRVASEEGGVASDAAAAPDEDVPPPPDEDGTPPTAPGPDRP